MRAVHIFPDLPIPNTVSAYRDVHDPLAVAIAAHVTLVFPFDSPVSDHELVTHVKSIGAPIDEFCISFGQAEVHDGGIIWLPVLEGADRCIDLHNRLYAGLLRAFRSLTHCYQPHMTIGRVAPDQLAIAMSAAHSLTLDAPIRVHEVTIEQIGPTGTSEVIATIPLRKR